MSAIPLVENPEWIEDCAKWRGETLTGRWAHWCMDWDDLPVDETCVEFLMCECFDTDDADLVAAKAQCQRQRDELDRGLDATLRRTEGRAQ